MNISALAVFYIMIVIFWLAAIAAWITHLIVAIAAKAWLFMIVGALVFPVAIAHGVSVWLGYDWGLK